MSSSKGLGLRAHDLTKILPPELGRFLFSRSVYREQVEFNPEGTLAVPDLFDEYDRCWLAYAKGGDEDLARVFMLSQTANVPEKKEMFLPRFREVAYLLQGGKESLESHFKEKKGSDLTKEENEILEERIIYAEVWLKNLAPEEFRFEIKEEIITTLYPKFFAKLAEEVESSKTPEELEKKIYELIKDSNIASKEAFNEIYKVLTGKTHGPKAAWLIWENKDKATEVFKKVSK